MKRPNCREGLRAAAAAGLALSVLAPSVAAQVHLGRIDLIVEDTTGAVLPGASVTASGPEDRADVFTDVQGEAHLLRLPPGTYEVRVELPGFSAYLDTGVQVRAAASTPMVATLEVGRLDETITVTGLAPIVDPRRQSTDTHVTLEELQEIPSARDPWVVLQTIPGVIVDRVNVGGAESGQQSIYMAKGAGSNENTWTLDGVVITDMAFPSSPTYWDFDQFQEMRISTGGADVRNQTPGAAVDVVLKSGSNRYHGSVRGYFANEAMQRNNLSPELADAIGGETGRGNRMEQYRDSGFEVGGPLIRDRLWAWGSLGETDIRLRTLIDTADRTTLTNRALKVRGQVADGLRLGFSHFHGGKVKRGRGAGPTRPDETTWDQGDLGSGLYTGSGDWVGDNLVASAKGSIYDTGFFLTPRGGLDVEGVYHDVHGVWHNSFVDYRSYRPQRVASVDVNYFRANHELKLGFGWRKHAVESQSTWPGNGQVTIHLPSYPENGRMLPIIIADAVNNTEGRYLSFYASDRVSVDRFTLDLGVRFDRSTSSRLAASRGANPLVPDLLPALTAPALPNTHRFDVLAPRIGVSYALGGEAETLLRASYGQFASQLAAAAAGLLASPISYSEVHFLAVDRNGDGLAQPDELLLDAGIRTAIGFDPNDPTSTDSVNRVSPDLTSPRTHELIFGIDQELPIPNSALTTSVTYRRFTNLRWMPLIGVTSADYGVVDTLIAALPETGGGGSVSQDVYAPLPGVALPPGLGQEERNRHGYHQRYWGWETSFIKRLSNRWMARIAYSWNDHREYFTDRPAAIVDPTPTPTSPNRDGGLVITSTSGSGQSDVFFLTPKYQFVANGLYQAPLGINVAANLLVRQGYGQPYYERVRAPREGFKSVLLVPDVGAHRLPAIRSLDLRIGKEFRVNEVTLNIDLDWFNILNAGTVLGRQYDTGAAEGLTGPGRTLEIMNPSLLRLGLRLAF